MIVYDQLLPSLYHLQRIGVLGSIQVAASSSTRLKSLKDARFQEAFPGQTFTPWPSLDAPSEFRNTSLWREALATVRPFNLIVVATPDESHAEIVGASIQHDQHVLCVKPLVHRYAEAEEIGRLAHERGVLVAVEYHKRFDRRALEAKKQYRDGRFGEFVCGHARMVEPYLYRRSNFQHWFTCDKTDPFVYVGCHYVDLVYFITGLRPIEVSSRGVERTFPNGARAFLWANGRVVFENGAVLSVTGGLGYPDQGAGPNDQGLTMYCEGENCGAIVEHNDQFRGVGHGYIDNQSGAYFRHVNPDYFRLVPWQGPGLKPVGYGYDSVATAVEMAKRLNCAGTDSRNANERRQRQSELAAIDAAGLLATPRNSAINELVIEGARQSILLGGTPVKLATI